MPRGHNFNQCLLVLPPMQIRFCPCMEGKCDPFLTRGSEKTVGKVMFYCCSCMAADRGETALQTLRLGLEDSQPIKYPPRCPSLRQRTNLVPLNYSGFLDVFAHGYKLIHFTTAKSGITLSFWCACVIRFNIWMFWTY